MYGRTGPSKYMFSWFLGVVFMYKCAHTHYFSFLLFLFASLYYKLANQHTFNLLALASGYHPDVALVSLVQVSISGAAVWASASTVLQCCLCLSSDRLVDRFLLCASFDPAIFCSYFLV